MHLATTLLGKWAWFVSTGEEVEIAGVSRYHFAPGTLKAEFYTTAAS